jgi:hypothetical protein
MQLADRQRDFGAAILDNRLPAPPGLVGPDGLPSARRFAVYRNNVMVGLIDALADAFPVLRQLVGDQFFRAMAGVYARAEPPGSPVLLAYGAGFPGYVALFPPLAHMPWLADVARLERAWLEAYHAAEAVPADVTALLALPPADLGALRFSLHPSLRLVRSGHPVLTIWHTNQPGQTPAPLAMDQPEDVLILRPAAEVQLVRLDPGVAAFLAQIQAGETLSDAATAGFLATPRFDFAKALSALFLSGALTAWHSAPRHSTGVLA